MNVMHAPTVGLRSLLLTVFVALGGAAHARDVLPAAGQPVMLELVSGISAVCDNGFVFVRNSADGRPAGLFDIPTGHFLTITDVDWQYVSPPGQLAPNKIQTLRLFAVHDAAEAPGVRVFESTITLSSASQGGTSTAATTGAVLNAGVTLCVDVYPGPISGGGGLQHLVVRGILSRGSRP